MKNNLAILESDSVIASMTRASYALAEAVTVSQTKTIIDVARAAEIYAKRQHLSESAISQATSVKVEAMRKLGEILKATPKNKGVRTVGGDSRSGGSISAPPENSAPTLDELGLTKKESAVAQQLASLSDEAFEQVREGSVTIAKALAAVKADKEKPAPAIETARPAPVIEPEDDGAPDAEELASFAAAEKAEADAMRLLLASDAPLADVTEKYKQALIQNSMLEARIVGLQNENMVLVRTVKSLQTKLKRVEQPA